jgi:hypothetical protein
MRSATIHPHIFADQHPRRRNAPWCGCVGEIAVCRWEIAETACCACRGAFGWNEC